LELAYLLAERIAG